MKSRLTREHAEGIAAARALTAWWQTAREDLKADAARAHPDVTDVLGRIWTWAGGDLWTHCGMAWPLEFVTRTEMCLPAHAIAQHPDDPWCGICRATEQAQREAAA